MRLSNLYNHSDINLGIISKKIIRIRPAGLSHLDIFNLHLIDLLCCDGFFQTIIPEVIIFITLDSDPKKDSLGTKVGEGVVPAYPIVPLLTDGGPDNREALIFVVIIQLILYFQEIR